MKLFIALILSHFCGDVLVNFIQLSRAKRNSSMPYKIAAISFHCFLHVIWVVIWLELMDIDLNLLSGSFIFLSHFIIDLSRSYFEEKLIGSEDFKILHRKEVFLWLFHRASFRTNDFMNKYFRKWLFINITDQCLHILAIVSFSWYANVAVLY